MYIGWGERESDVRDVTKQRMFTIGCTRGLGVCEVEEISEFLLRNS